MNEIADGTQDVDQSASVSTGGASTANDDRLARLPHSSQAAWPFWALLVLAFVAPAAGLVVTVRTVPDEVRTLSPPVEPLVVEARLAEIGELHPASGELTWIDGPAIAAPAWSGLVTSVSVSVGETVETGTLLARIDGVDRIAVASSQPFHRALGAGDRGPDVAMLRKALGDLGYPTEPVLDKDYVDWRMAGAVRRLEARLTHEEAAQGVGTFLPEWFGWLPRATLAVHQVGLEVGRPAPPAGEPVVSAPPVPEQLTVTVTSENAQLEADGGYEFVAGDAIVPLASGLTADRSDVAELAGQVRPGAEVVEGAVRLVDARSSVVVPIAAVQADPRGGHCVVRADGREYTPVPVVVGDGDIGTAEIARGLAAGTQLVANPAEVGLSCG